MEWKYWRAKLKGRDIVGKRIDIMVDIETLGTGLDATVIQVAAVSFDIVTGERLAVFNEIVDVDKMELNVDGSTLKWWMKKDADLLGELISAGWVSPARLWYDLAEWLATQGDTENRYLWGNGILFDNAIIREQMTSRGLPYPIHYRNDRDVRTLVDLYAAKTGQSYNEVLSTVVFKGRRHDALDDVEYQIELVTRLYKELIG